MGKKTKVQHQAEYLKYASDLDLFEYAVAFDNDPNDDNIPPDDEGTLSD